MIKNKSVLLYNTLDSSFILSCDPLIIELVEKIQDVNNCGVVLLEEQQYMQENIFKFIIELRNKYMGDIIDVKISQKKPIVLYPMLNLQQDFRKLKTHEEFVKNSFFDYLINEIHIELNNDTSIAYLNQIGKILKGIPPVFNIKIFGLSFNNICQVHEFVNHKSNIIIVLNCQSVNKEMVQAISCNDISIEIIVTFPLDITRLDKIWQLYSQNSVVVKNILFQVTNIDEYAQAEELINRFSINKCHIEPVYNENNLSFFEKYVYLTEIDILECTQSMREIFAHKTLNTFDFGKLTIKTNGDVYANVHHPPLGNVTTHSIHEMLYKEMSDGESWLRIRDQEPCNNCIYQWLCPSPSNYEIVIGQPNLCHVNS